MKTRPRSSSGKSIKSATAKKASAVRSRKPHRASSATLAEDKPTFAELEIITIMPPGFDEPPLSSKPEKLRRARFGIFQPDATEVFVAGSFNNWNPRATPMKRDAYGDWSVEVQLPPGEYRYRFLVDGEWRDDPAARLTAMNSYGGFDAVVVV